MRLRSTTLLVSALFAIPALAHAQELDPQPRAKRALAHGTDDSLPAPRGEVFYQPRDSEQFAGLSDAEVATAPGMDLSAHDPHATLHFTEHTCGTWIRGRSYKARVNESGFRYVPFLGSTAPQNWPVDFRLESAVLDGVPMELSTSATVERHGERFVLDRGPVEVLYDFSLDSVEQSFALDLPSSSGDLVLSLSVQSDLTAATKGAGFRFAGPSGGLDYGAAVVFDAAGRSAEIPATLDGERLRLTVPAAFLAEANGPILVDPVLSTFTVDTASGDQQDIDVAYDRTNDVFTYVYEDTFSGTDRDIYSTTFTSGGTFVSGIYVDSSDEYWADPSIANLNAPNRNLIVAMRYAPGTAYGEIVGRIMDVTALTLGPEFIIGEGNASWDNFRPDVGGNSSGGALTVFLVVWEREFATNTQPRYRTVISDGSMGPIQFFDNGLYERTNIVISESTGDPATVNQWNVAYRSEDLTNGNVSLRGLQINAGGGIIAGPSNLVSLPNGEDLDEVDVSEALSLDGYSPTHAISYDLDSPAAQNTHIVFCRGTSVLNTVSLQLSEHAPMNRQRSEARLSTTYEDFMVSYLELQPGGDFEAYITSFDLTEGRYLAVSERKTFLGFTGTNAWYVGEGVPMASRFSGGYYNSRICSAAWTYRNSTDLDAIAATYIADAGLTQAFQYCYGNLNSTGDRGFLSMFGDRSTTGTKFLEASALPSNTFGYFFCGQGFANVANPGGSQGVLCVGGTLGRYSNAVANTGANGRLALSVDPAAMAQPTGPVPALAGQLWQFQCWHRDSAGGSATSNFTNAVTMLFR